jgi:hypothetical protein
MAQAFNKDPYLFFKSMEQELKMAEINRLSMKMDLKSKEEESKQQSSCSNESQYDDLHETDGEFEVTRKVVRSDRQQSVAASSCSSSETSKSVALRPCLSTKSLQNSTLSENLVERLTDDQAWAPSVVSRTSNEVLSASQRRQPSSCLNPEESNYTASFKA